MSPRKPVLFLEAITVLLFTATFAAAEPRDAKWLTGYITQPVGQSPRGKIYLEEIDRAPLKDAIDHDWLKHGEDSGLGRLYATRIGQLAFAWRTPGTRWHRDAGLFADIRAGLRGFAAHQTAEGRFVWSQQQKYEYQAHEHVWRLEPLLLGYLWIGDDLPADERTAALSMLKRGGEYLLSHPLTEANNRGAAWAAGALLCGLAFDDPRYRQLVNEHLAAIMTGVVHRTGEVVETQGGGGPDGNYSYVGFAYAWMIHRLSGEEKWREPLRQATRWMTQYTTLAGAIVLPGATTRKARAWGEVAAVLPALEDADIAEPFFAQAADRYLRTHAEPVFGRGGILAHPVVWALLEEAHATGDSRTRPALDREELTRSLAVGTHWYAGHATMYEWPRVQYLLVGRPGYQSGLSVRSDFKLTGLQVFAPHGGEPVVIPTGADLSQRSFFEAEEINTALTPVSRGPLGAEVVWRSDEGLPDWPGKLPVVSACLRQQHLWSGYVFTPASVLVVYGGGRGASRIVWSLHPRDQPSMESGVITTSPATSVPSGGTIHWPGRTGAIAWLQGKGELVRTENQQALEIKHDRGMNACGLSDGSFQFLDYDVAGERLTFIDRSGKYDVSWPKILTTEGHLDREAGLRVMVTAAK